MDKPVAAIMTKVVVTVDSEAPLLTVARLFGEHRLTAAPVVDEKGNLFGIISAADIVRAHAAGKNLQALQAWEICTHRPIQVPAGTSIAQVARIMLDKKIHHIVIGEGKSIEGIVS